jgi:hypothetical protein
MNQTDRPRSAIGRPLIGLVAFVALIGGLFVAAWGLWGTFVVFSDWRPCVDPQATPVGDVPSNYCDLVNWPVQFGIGMGLVAVGVVAVVAGVRLARRLDSRARPSAG